MFLKIGLPIISGLLLIVVIVLFYFRCFRGGRAGYHPRREFMSMGDVSIVSSLPVHASISFLIQVANYKHLFGRRFAK